MWLEKRQYFTYSDVVVIEKLSAVFWVSDIIKSITVCRNGILLFVVMNNALLIFAGFLQSLYECVNFVVRNQVFFPDIWMIIEKIFARSCIR